MKNKLFENVMGNSFRIASPQSMGMMRETQIPTTDLQSMWEEDQHGEYIQINPDDSIYYIAHGKAMEQIAPKGTDTQTGFRMVANWGKMNGVSYNIWQVNDHGNVELYDQSGKSLGGLV